LIGGLICKHVLLFELMADWYHEDWQQTWHPSPR